MFNKEMLGKIQDLKKQAEDSKNRLEEKKISEEAGGGLIRVSMNGNRKLVGIEVNADLKTIDKEELEDLIMVAFERAMNRVNDINEKEVMTSAQSLFPGM